MTAVLRGLLFLVIGLVIAALTLWIVGPYEEVDTDIDFRASAIPDDIDGWLADAEGQVANLRPEAAKKVLWARGPGQKTDIAIVYLHGFSADPWEIRPVPDRVAQALGANLFFQRLTGHGRDGAAMAEPSAGDWLEDVAEAMEVGRRLGDRVVVIGTSTGGTLAAALAADPALADLREGLAGVVFVSPNFRIANPMAKLLSLPAARYWAPVLAGDTRSFEPQNARHGEHWTTEYPSVSALPMQALIDHVAGLPIGDAEVPALFYLSLEDSVVDPATTQAVASRWGGPVAVETVTLQDGDDSYNHVIAGDILSPAQTPLAIESLTRWISGL